MSCFVGGNLVGVCHDFPERATNHWSIAIDSDNSNRGEDTTSGISIGPPPLAGLAATRGGLGSARRAGLGRAGQGQGVSAPWGHAGMIAVLVVARRGGHNLVNMWR